MDKVDHYREIIRRTLTSLADFINQHWRQPQAEAHCVIDVEHDQHLLVKTGWTKTQRVRGTTLYLRLRDGKVWIEEDWTEEGISKDLVAAGIPPEDIVLAFHSPEPRLLTEAVADERNCRHIASAPGTAERRLGRVVEGPLQ